MPDTEAADDIATPARVTLRDVAERAGVHVSTVSRALNQPPTRLSRSPVAVKIRRIAREMGYQPDPGAASLRSGRTQAIGVIMPRLSDVVVGSVFEAIEATADEHGMHTLVVVTGDSPEEQARKLDLLLGRRVDGLLIGTAMADDPMLERAQRLGIPYVLVLRRSGSHPAVTIDDELGGYLAAQHLIERGHRRLAVVSGPPTTSTAIDRLAGFRRACRGAGIELDPADIIEEGFDVKHGYDGGQRLVAAVPRPTGIFAVNDYVGIGVIGCFREHGLVVGRDFALVGYHDMAISEHLMTPLSSIHSPLPAIGRQAADLLLARLRGESVASVRIEPTLIVRASSAASLAEMQAAGR